MIGRLREWLRKRRTQALQIGAEQWQHAEQELPFLDYLSAAERLQLREMSRRFLAEKQMFAAAGLQLSEAIQLSIALQACLPVLRLGLDWYRGWVGIIVYPGDFVIPRQEIDDQGIVHEFDDTVLGEAWDGGPVLLSWFDTRADIGTINVVIHEFAHKLDMLNGSANGQPPLHQGMLHADWYAAFTQAYSDFCARVAAAYDDADADDEAEELALDPYAAESPAEFFAVMSEAFFETPALLLAEYPAVYRQLSLFYRQDPLGVPTHQAGAVIRADQ